MTLIKIRNKGGDKGMKKKLVSIILVAMLVSAGLFIFVGNAVAEIGTHAKAVPCVEANIQSMSKRKRVICM